MVGNGKAMFVNGTERKLISSEANYDVIVFLLQLRVRATLHLSRVYDGRRLSQPRSMKPGSPFQNEHPLRQKATECVRGYYTGVTLLIRFLPFWVESHIAELKLVVV